MKATRLIFAAAALALICVTGCGRGNADAKNEKKAGLSDEEKKAAKAVLKELIKLNSFTDAGINHGDYQAKVLTAKGEIDTQLVDIPAGDLKTALQESLQAYVDAREFWGLAMNRGQSQLQYFYLTPEEMTKYGKYGNLWGKGENGKDGLTGAKFVTIFWAFGAESQKRAEALLAK